MGYNYSSNAYNKEHMARAIGRGLPISTKASINICNSIKHKSVARAKVILKEAIALKTPIKYTRFTEGAGHKPGMASGKYPQRASEEILALIEAVESNAQFKGLNTSDLIITHISAQDAGNVWRYGRHKRRKQKRTHIEIIVEESRKEAKSELKNEVKKNERKTSEKKPEKVKEAKDKK